MAKWLVGKEELFGFGEGEVSAPLFWLALFDFPQLPNRCFFFGGNPTGQVQPRWVASGWGAIMKVRPLKELHILESVNPALGRRGKLESDVEALDGDDVAFPVCNSPMPGRFVSSQNYGQ
jgi:hypothetical protein